MKNTDYSIESLKSIITSESSLEVLLDLISDMDLELEVVRAAAA